MVLAKNTGMIIIIFFRNLIEYAGVYIIDRVTARRERERERIRWRWPVPHPPTS